VGVIVLTVDPDSTIDQAAVEVTSVELHRWRRPSGLRHGIVGTSRLKPL
jgi:hypothetical protein